MTKIRTKEDYRLQGIAAALGELAHMQLNSDLARTVLASMTLTVQDLRDAGADAQDVKILKE